MTRKLEELNEILNSYYNEYQKKCEELKPEFLEARREIEREKNKIFKFYLKKGKIKELKEIPERVKYNSLGVPFHITHTKKGKEEHYELLTCKEDKKLHDRLANLIDTIAAIQEERQKKDKVDYEVIRILQKQLLEV